MKTVLIDGSPKKKGSTSGYFLSLQAASLRGEKVFMKLRGHRDHGRILEQLKDAQVVVFSVPLYIDSLPAHVLDFLRDMEKFCRECRPDLKVYVIANNGFIEGRQNESLFNVMKNFCARSRLQWGGGIGIGGGVMFHALKIAMMVVAGLFVTGLLVSGFRFGNWLPFDLMHRVINTLLLLVFFQLGALFEMAGMARKINRCREFGEHYTRILLPSFIFIPVADLFFLLVSLFRGGLFRGWLKRKKE
ncbi:MAG: hypothetical protein ACOX4I_04725 [Anaerovoracaceae bacterium]|jgi:hypothetical protein